MNRIGPPEPGDLEEFEERVWAQIRELQERHRLEVAPLLKILQDINACKPPAPIVIDMSTLTDAQKQYWLDHVKSIRGIEE